MKVSGMRIPTREMEEVTKFGPMDHSMKGTGRTIKQMVEVA